MKRISFLVLLLLISLIPNACGATPSPPPLTQTVGSVSATLQILPYPPVPMEKTTLELTLSDAGGQPVSGASVRFDLTMPGMEMPPNRPNTTDEGNGVYRSQTIFTMAGKWQIRVEVSHPGGSEQFTFLISTK